MIYKYEWYEKNGIEDNFWFDMFLWMGFFFILVVWFIFMMKCILFVFIINIVFLC